MKLATINAISPAQAFTVASGALQVTDPCYTPGTWCAGVIEDVKNGTWLAHMGFHDDAHGWGTRVAYLHIVHSEAQRHFDHMTELDSTWENSKIDVGVDSGQAGFFDRDAYIEAYETNQDKFYDEVCQITSEIPNQCVHAIGAVSSSGYGDGGYDCLIRRVDGQIVEAMIVFIAEYEEDEEVVE